jgi:Xaa-Pro aminopeptidase
MKERIENVQKNLSKWNVEALVVSATQDLLYLTGLELSRGTLCIAKDRICLIVDGRYFEACKDSCPFEVQLLQEGVLKELLCGYKKIGFDQDAESFSSYTRLSALVPQGLTPLSKPIVEIRAVKDAVEIQKIATACSLCTEGFDFAISLLQEGVTEKTVACELEIFWKKRGADRLAFSPIIAFGKNSFMPHYRAGNTKLCKNELVLIDIGVVYDGYNSDMTRMAYFGKVDPKLEEICKVVQKAQAAAVLACRAGMLASELDTVARDVVKQAGFGEYFVHGLGHGVGLDIHEEPTIKKDPAIKDTKLLPGMVVTIEPGIYLPHVGGARIEDTVVVQEDGCVNLIKRSHEPIAIKIF